MEYRKGEDRKSGNYNLFWDERNYLNQDLRFSGEATISFQAAIDQPTTILSAMIVDLGEDYRITSEEIENDIGEISFKLEEKPSKFKVITRGRLNAQNRNSIWSKEEIKKGEYYEYNFSFVPTDYMIKKGNKLGLIIYGIDAEATQRPSTVTKITIKQESIKLNCPAISKWGQFFICFKYKVIL